MKSEHIGCTRGLSSVMYRGLVSCVYCVLPLWGLSCWYGVPYQPAVAQHLLPPSEGK